MSFSDYDEYLDTLKQFFTAVINNDNETAIRLLAEGLSVDKSCPRYRPIHHSRATAKRLGQQHNPQPFVYPVGMTPLMIAIRNNNRVLFDHFIEKGADIYCGGYAASGGDEPEVSFIGTPVHVAAKGRPEMLRVLLDMGVPPDYRGAKGFQTPLASACYKFHPQAMPCIRMLVSHGADIIQMDKHGNTLLFMSMILGSQSNELLAFLLDGGIDIYHKNKDDKTVFDIDGPFNDNFKPQFDEGMDFLKNYRKQREENKALDGMITNTTGEEGEFNF